MEFFRAYNYIAFTLDGNWKGTAHTTPSGQSTGVRERIFVHLRIPHLRELVLSDWGSMTRYTGHTAELVAPKHQNLN